MNLKPLFCIIVSAIVAHGATEVYTTKPHGAFPLATNISDTGSVLFQQSEGTNVPLYRFSIDLLKQNLDERYYALSNPSNYIASGDSGVSLSGIFSGELSGNFNGIFTGDGSFLTKLPTWAVTNGQSDVALNGYFSGDGSGLYDLNGSTIVSGTVPEARMPSITASGSSTARSLAARFAEVVNVDDFGADPTGATDSTAAISNATARVLAVGGGVLKFGIGTYKYSGTWTPPAATIRVEGQSHGGSMARVTIWQFTQTDGATAILMAGGNYLHGRSIRNIQILGNTSAGDGVAILEPAQGHIDFSGVMVKGFGGWGMVWSNSYIHNMEKVYVSNNTKGGIKLDGSNEINVRASQFSSNSGPGMLMTNCTACNINADFSVNATNLWITGTSLDNRISGWQENTSLPTMDSVPGTYLDEKTARNVVDVHSSIWMRVADRGIQNRIYNSPNSSDEFYPNAWFATNTFPDPYGFQSNNIFSRTATMVDGKTYAARRFVPGAFSTSTWVETNHVEGDTIWASMWVRPSEDMNVDGVNSNRFALYLYNNLMTNAYPYPRCAPFMPSNQWTYLSFGTRLDMGGTTNAALLGLQFQWWNLVNTSMTIDFCDVVWATNIPQNKIKCVPDLAAAPLINSRGITLLPGANLQFLSPRWVDEKINGMAVRAGGTSPVRTEVQAGTGIYGTGFDAGDDSDFSVQFMHGLASTNASFQQFYYDPHIHLTSTTTNSGTNIAFKITYQISAPSTQFSNTTVTVTNYIGAIQPNLHRLLSFGPITNNLLSGKDSVVVRGNISCLTNNTGGRVILDSMDFHIPIDTIGSTAINGD